jgi:hypothetical protein
MLLLAVSTLDKIHAVPGRFWINCALVIGGFIAAFIIIRKLAGMNKIVLGVVGFVILTVFGFQWVYERNEPKFLSPFIDRIAPFFPSKGSYATSQQVDPLTGKKTPPAPTPKPSK